MNGLSWLKEFALRSKTADVMSGIKAKAEDDAARTFEAINARKVAMDALKLRLESSERETGVLEAGRNQRAEMDAEIERAKAAVQASKDREALLNSIGDNANVTGDPDYAQKLYAGSGFGGDPRAAAHVEALRRKIEAAGKKAEPNLRDEKRRTFLTLDDPASMERFARENAEFISEDEARAKIMDAKAKAARLAPKPEKPEAPRVPTVGNILEVDKAIDDIRTKLKTARSPRAQKLTPGGNAEEIKELEERLKNYVRISARMRRENAGGTAAAGSSGAEDPLAAKLLAALGVKK